MTPGLAPCSKTWPRLNTRRQPGWSNPDGLVPALHTRVAAAVDGCSAAGVTFCVIVRGFQQLSTVERRTGQRSARGTRRRECPRCRCGGAAAVRLEHNDRWSHGAGSAGLRVTVGPECGVRQVDGSGIIVGSDDKGDHAGCRRINRAVAGLSCRGVGQRGRVGRGSLRCRCLRGSRLVGRRRRNRGSILARRARGECSQAEDDCCGRQEDPGSKVDSHVHNCIAPNHGCGHDWPGEPQLHWMRDRTDCVATPDPTWRSRPDGRDAPCLVCVILHRFCRTCTIDIITIIGHIARHLARQIDRR